MHYKSSYLRYKNSLEGIKKFDIFSLYVNAVFIGFWVFFKWFVSYLWFIVHSSNSRRYTDSQKSSSENPVRGVTHERPPNFVLDNYFGRHSYVKVKGVKFHYVECGNVNDPAILLLHGFPDCWFGWRHQIKELSRFFRVIVLDLKGFNDSDKPMWRRYYKPEQICRELAAFVRALNISSSVSLIGHDLGAIIGWLFIHTNPDLVNRFICVSAPHPNLFWNNINKHSKKSAINLTWLRLVQLPYIPEMEHTRPDSNFLERCLSHMNYGFGEKNTIQTDVKCEQFYESIMDAYRYVFSRKSDWTGPFNYYRNLPYYRVREGSTISCPCLIITGNEDPLYRLESLISSTEFCDSFVVKIIEGAGHFPHQERSDEFNQIILKFLVGQRANPNHERTNNHTTTRGDVKLNDNIVGKIFGLVSGGVIRVHAKTNELLHHMSIN